MKNVFFQIKNLETREKYFIDDLEECRNETDLMAAKLCVAARQSVEMGKTIVTIHEGIGDKMGHDIFAFKNKDKEGVIAYYRASIWCETRHTLYELLACQDLNCGVSGCGESREFALDQVKAAAKKAAEMEYWRELEFLVTILNRTDSNTVTITFS